MPPYRCIMCIGFCTNYTDAIGNQVTSSNDAFFMLVACVKGLQAQAGGSFEQLFSIGVYIKHDICLNFTISWWKIAINE